jgi:hypothetical protein
VRLLFIIFLINLHLFKLSKANFRDEQRWFVDIGYGTTTKDIKVTDFNLKQTYKIKSIEPIFSLGIGYHFIDKDLFFEIYAGIVAEGKDKPNQFEKFDNNYKFYLSGAYNNIILVTNLGLKINRFEPYITSGISFVSFSPKTIFLDGENIKKEIQNNYLIPSFIFGIGVNFLYTEKLKITLQTYRINSAEGGSENFQKAKIKSLFLITGLKYYF